MKRYTTRWERMNIKRTQESATPLWPLMAGEVHAWRRQGMIQRLRVGTVVLGLTGLLVGTIFYWPARAPTLVVTAKAPVMVADNGLQPADIPVPSRADTTSIPLAPSRTLEPRSTITQTLSIKPAKNRPRVRRAIVRYVHTPEPPQQPALMLPDITPRVEAFYKYEISPGRSYRYSRTPPIERDYIPGTVPRDAFLITHPE